MYGGKEVYKLFNKIPVTIRKENEGYPDKEFIGYILFSFFGLELYRDIDKIKEVWINNKNGSEIVVEIAEEGKQRVEIIEGIQVVFEYTGELEIEENIVKKTAKELGISQKDLAERLKTSEVSLSRWAKGQQEIPEWALEMFNLLKTEKKYNEAKNKFKELNNIFS